MPAPADAAHIAAEKRHAQTIGAPGILLIDGIRCQCRIFTERGLKYTELGGSLQQRKLSAIILTSILPATHLLTSSSETRSQPITHIHPTTGARTEYRIDPGGVDLSPFGVYWSIEASQATAQK